MSKGSKQRPTQVSMQEAFNNWDRIFGKKKKEEPKDCGGECNICIKNPDSEQIHQIQEPNKEND